MRVDIDLWTTLTAIAAGLLALAALMIRTSPDQVVSFATQWARALLGKSSPRWLDNPDTGRIIQRVASLALVGLAWWAVCYFLDVRSMKPVALILIFGGLLAVTAGTIWHVREPNQPSLSRPGVADPASNTYTPVLPKLPTISAKEDFHRVLTELLGMMRTAKDNIAISPDAIASSQPIASAERPAAEPLAVLQGRLATYQQIDDRLFSTGEGPFFREHPLYRTELLAIMPRDSQDVWVRFNVALRQYIDAIAVIQDAEPHGANSPQFQRALKNGSVLQVEYAKAMQAVRAWADSINERVRLTIQAIP